MICNIIAYNLYNYSSDTFRGLHEILMNATTFRFDGSDLMPGWVGAGSFWTGMVDYTNGKSAQDVADGAQAAAQGSGEIFRALEFFSDGRGGLGPEYRRICLLCGGDG